MAVLSTETILAGLAGPIKPVRRSPLYLFGLMIVALALLLLPLIYVGLIVGACWLIYYHAVTNVNIFDGHFSRGRAIAYVVPLMVGPLLILFMIKPLFARRARQSGGRVVNPDREPLLHAYVARLCERVGAPNPRVIELDCAVNASAGFRRGWLSFLAGNDLKLTLGLPLAAGLTLREFSGVLAHEFGHFTQGLAMRLTYVIRNVNGWFARVVYERDGWDEWLLAMRQESDRFSLVALITQGLVWLTRRILWLLMILGHGVSCFMLRRMEFDADRTMVRVAGDEAFGQTLAKLRLLSMAAEISHAQLRQSWQQRRLADDLPRLIVTQADQAPAEFRQALVSGESTERTGLFDTHPSDADRRRRAQREAGAGIVSLDEPATVLFTNFEAACRTVSLDFYREVLGPTVEPKNLVATQQLVTEHRQSANDQAELDRYFGHDLLMSRPFIPRQTRLEPIEDAKATLQQLRQAHQKVKDGLRSVRGAYTLWEAADTSLFKCAQAAALCKGQVPFRAEALGLPSNRLEAIEQLEREAQHQCDRSGVTLAEYEILLTERLTAALRLAKHATVRHRLGPAAEGVDNAERLLQVLAALEGAVNDFRRFQIDLAVLVMSARLLEHDPENHTLQGMLTSRAGAVYDYLQNSRAVLRETAYPFDHAGGEVTVADYLLDYVPGRSDFGRLVGAAATFGRNLSTLYSQTLGRLATLALAVERLAKLPGVRETQSSSSASERRMAVKHDQDDG